MTLSLCLCSTPFILTVLNRERTQVYLKIWYRFLCHQLHNKMKKKSIKNFFQLDCCLYSQEEGLKSSYDDFFDQWNLGTVTQIEEVCRVQKELC